MSDAARTRPPARLTILVAVEHPAVFLSLRSGSVAEDGEHDL